jgi:hypothetical protein
MADLTSYPSEVLWALQVEPDQFESTRATPGSSIAAFGGLAAIDS